MITKETTGASGIMAIWMILDPQFYLCDAQNCYAKLNGQMLYADDDHLSIEVDTLQKSCTER